MQKIIYIIIALLLAAAPGWCKMERIRLKNVEVTGGLWSELQALNRDISIPHQYDMLRDSRRLEAMSGLWNGKETLTPEEKETAKKTGQPHIFWDSDVAKWIEAAAYVLAKEPNLVFEQQIDEIVEGIEKLQRPDGYINSYFIFIEPENRWRNLRWRHELYCAGHLMEAAAAYYEATGKDRLLRCICRYADYIDSVFGPEDGKMRGYPGHEEIELALVRLYEVTGNSRYLRLADHFLSVRGTRPHYWDYEAEADAEFNKAYVNTPLNTYHYAQAHLPVREQREALGHAVRAGYLYCGMTDVGRINGDSELLTASREIWKDVTEKKQYITGGVGSDPSTEGYSEKPYFLPNERAYCEACASIAFIFWTQRLLQAEPRAEYADRIERTLYNALMAAMSQDGAKYFYVNPLETSGSHHRSGWFGCSCCPPNIARLYANIGEYIYSADGGKKQNIYIHQYIASKADVGENTVRQETDYPFDSRVKIEIAGPDAVVSIRIPSWCSKPRVTVNGRETKVKKAAGGYMPIEHSGRTEILVELPMEIIYNTAPKQVEENRGKLCLSCGPFVYCLEETDNGCLDDLVIKKGGAVKTDRALFDRYPVIRAAGIDCTDPAEPAECRLTFVPYCVWDNREPGAMKVWIPEKHQPLVSLDGKTKAADYLQVRRKGAWTVNPEWVTSVVPGSCLVFDMEGDVFRVEYLGYDDAGIFQVEADGKVVETIDEYAPKRHTPMSREISGLGDGRHRIRLIVSDDKNPASGGKYVNFVRAVCR
ncbi:MAG: glycoside hydrolase family 127 protein [Abditibacteriota bacterium]|nr:glycoside hydrolase family 127 protein [Abditibacteriota bacterium]